MGRTLALPFDPHCASGPDADDEATRADLIEPGLLLQPTHTRVFRIDLDQWQVLDHFSHPLMSSVHSASVRPEGGCVVSCAGNDSVLLFDRHEQLVAHHWLREGDFAAAYPGVDDFRRLHHDALKPHSHHPNAAFELDGQLWATCFETRELRTVDGSRRIAVDGIPHDGAPQEGALWLTTVAGRVEGRDPVDGRLIEALDLRELAGSRRLLGWCRGIAVVGRRAFVGMSQLRSTTHREVARVLLRGERGRKHPSRVLEIDLDRRQIVGEVQVGGRGGATIYGVTHSP